MKISIQVIVLCLLLLEVSHGPPAWAQGVDVYMVYSGKNRTEKNLIQDALPKALSIKTYNVDLLVLADYSGKQKVVARLEKARMILILQDSPMDVLKGSRVKKTLLVVKSLKKTVKSEKWMLHVMATGTDLGKLKSKVKILKAIKKEDLEDAEAIRSSEVVLVDEKSLEFSNAVSLIVEQILSL